MTNHDRTLTTTIAISTLAVAVLAPLGAAGCDKKKHGEPAKTSKVVAADVSKARAAIPEDLAGKLDFETATLADDNLTAVVPKGWTPSKVIPGSYRPTREAKLGFMTSYKVGSNCDGTCESKNWKATADKVEFARLTDGKRFKVVKDEAIQGGRLVIAEGSSTTVVAAAWWRKGAERYFYCRASLDKPANTAVAAFEHACRNTQITSW